ncbi:MAG TPA: glycosyltransferase family 9 protein [Candidatus Methylomirabilis sp.]|nr:glycosyltransferase family 9 protein [Candidatus Methylomirabilis sp.]
MKPSFWGKLKKYTARKIANFLIDAEIFFQRQTRHSDKTALLVKPEGIGDYLLFYSTLKYYLTAFPDYKFYLLASKRNSAIARDLNRRDQTFAEIIELDKEKFASNFFYRRSFCLDVFKRNFNLVIYPTSWREPKCDLIIQASRAPRKIVFSGNGYYLDWEKKAADAAYAEIITVPENLTREIDKYKFFAEKVSGQKVNYEAPALTLPPESYQAADKICQELGLKEKKFVVIFPGSADRYKIWSRDNFSEVIKFLLSRQLTAVVAGADFDQQFFDEILKYLPDEHRSEVVNLCGRTSLLVLGGILKKSLFYFGSDTGVMHLAAAVGCPVICLLGGGHFGRFFPYGDLSLNRIVYDKEMKCRNDEWACAQKNKLAPAPCVAGIKVSEAINEINSLLAYLN